MKIKVTKEEAKTMFSEEEESTLCPCGAEVIEFSSNTFGGITYCSDCR